jgi:amino acid adenylation domain-containing protein
VARRGELIQAQPSGSMLSIRLPEEDVRPLLTPPLAIAAVNSPHLCVVSGPHGEIAALEKRLESRGVTVRHLHTSHAFHSPMMDPVIEPFTALLRGISYGKLSIPFVSNVTARWITEREAGSPEYWAGHVRQTVRFADGIGELLKDAENVLLEVGPGQTLTTLARQHRSSSAEQAIIPSLPLAGADEERGLLEALGRLWMTGRAVDWPAFQAPERRLRVVLPTYPFERKRFWPEPAAAAEAPVLEPPSPPLRPTGTDPQPAAARRDRLFAEARSLMQELSGYDLSGVDPSTDFLELGLDSLLLTQAAQLFQRKFGVAISFRHLMEELSSLDAIAAHLDAVLPADAFAAAPAAPPPAPRVPTEATPAGTLQNPALEQLWRQQQELTQQLLQLMGRPPAVAPAPLSVAPAAIPAAAPAAAAPAKPEVKTHGPFKPIDKSAGAALSPQQSRALEALIARYVKRTAGSKKYTDQYRPVLADPRSVAGFNRLWKEMVYPIITARSDGSKVWDIDGNEYVDFVMGFGASMFGHRPPFVVQAVHEQLDRGFEIGPLQLLAGEVATLVSELTGMPRVAFTNTGSEAVLAATRVARTVTGRDKIAVFAGAYHGIFDEVLFRPVTVNGETRTASIAPGIPNSALGQVIVLDYGNPQSLDILRRRGPEIAAVLVEPVQSRRLDLQPREFLQELRRVTQETGSALIFDEVVTGFRVHPGGAQAHFDVRADLATYGKVIGGGLPIGVVSGEARFMDALDGGQWRYGDASFPEVGVTFFAGTFVRHPLVLAAAKAVLLHLKQSGPALQRNLTERTARVAHRLQVLIDEFRAPYHLTQFSSIMQLTPASNQRYAGLLFYLLRERGIHIYENRAFIMTTAHGDDDLTRLADVFKESLTEMRSSELSSFGTAAAESSTAPAGDSFPLTEAQKEIWYATQMGGLADAAFNESITLRFDGPFREDHFREAVRQVLSRHGILRAHFSADGERQQIDAGLDPEIPKDDLSALEGEAREAALAALVDRESSTPFDLTRGHLVRFRIVKLGPDSHRVIWTPHHIVCDGWSATIVLGELARIYSALSRGEAVRLEEQTPFREYVALQSTQAESPEVLEALSYWKRQFAEPPPALDLPSDRPRPPIRSFRASTLSLALTEATLAALKKTAAGQRTTLVVLMMAAVKTLLFRLSGGSDLVIGLPVAEQAMIGKHHLIGHCVNLLPIRTQLTAETPFREYLGAVKQALLDAYDHQQCTFGTIVQHLPLPRVSGRSPLVDVLFNIDRNPGGVEFEGLKFAAVRNPKKAMNFDFFFNFTEGSGGLELQCDYNTDLFDETTVCRWLGHLRTLLEGIIARPDQTLGELPLLDQAERRRILVEWNQTRRDYPRDRGVHWLFETQAGQSAGQCAVVCGASSLTYAELNGRANRLAHHLQGLGIRPQSLVGLYVERSLDMVVAVLAVLKAGGAYVPLDPTYPPERLAYMLTDTEAPVIITHKRLSDAQGLPPHRAQMVYLDSEWDLIARCSADNPSVDIKPEHLAYVLYTSGSTGKPKGVQISHGSLTNLITSMQREPGLGAADTLLSVTTLSFDIAGLELYLPLTVGARLVIASREDAVDARRLIDLLRDLRITAMQATPATWRMLLEAGWTGSPGLKIISGGEVMTRDLANQLLSRKALVWNGYGPTETTIYSTLYRVLPDEKALAVPIGRPIANTEIYILDPRKQPVPIGVPGDLFISGDGVARGYLHQPELTADKFIPDPFAAAPDKRMYHTGDRASFRPDGNIDFLGRSDFQVKIRGYRVELGEIEAVLAGHPLIKQAVVTLREDSPGEKRLAAYVVLSDSRGITPQQLREHVRSKLPEYMVPGIYIFLPSLPLTPNGKIDRKALPRPDKDAAVARERFEPPASALEQTLAGLWSETLGVARVGRQDNFFDLGGHSLLAAKLFTKIERSLGQRLPLATLFRAPTLEQLARVLQPEKSSSLSWMSLVPIHPQGSKRPFFCVHGGAGNVLLFRRLAFHIGPDQPFYGLQSQGLDGKTKYLTTVEEMAAHYQREIRQVQPQGPYFLGGYCMGGAVAYEIAQRFQREGETVAFLGMIDTYYPEEHAESRSFSRRLDLFRQKIRFHWENMAQLGPHGGSQYVVRKIALAKDRELARWSVRIGNLFKRIHYKAENRVFAVFLEDVNDRAGQAYRPQPWSGKVTFFKPQSNYDSDIHFELGWDRLAQGGFELIELPLNPGGLFVEPYVLQLAGELRGRLEEAQLASGRG